MRTDSLRISEEARQATDEFIKDNYGAKYLPEKPRYYKSRSNAQDGHEAIRPSTVSLTPAMVKDSLTPEQQEQILSGVREKRRKKRRSKGVLPPPPYTVQVQVQRRNPLRVQAQNELFIQAYTMAAQAGQQFPLVLLFEMLNVDGKERILPILKQVDQQTQMLQQLQAENQRLMQSEANLKQLAMEQSKALAGNVGQSAEAQEPTQEQQVSPEIAMGAGA
jgi:hypothetical protein